jgi:hypothetical protein
MEEASEDGKESLHSAHASGMNAIFYCISQEYAGVSLAELSSAKTSGESQNTVC